MRVLESGAFLPEADDRIALVRFSTVSIGDYIWQHNRWMRVEEIRDDGAFVRSGTIKEWQSLTPFNFVVQLLEPTDKE